MHHLRSQIFAETKSTFFPLLMDYFISVKAQKKNGMLNTVCVEELAAKIE